MKKTVAHSLHTYLFRTGSWVYTQLAEVKCFNHIVIATRKQNMEIFPWNDAFFISDLSFPNRFFQREYAKRTNFYYPYFYKILKRKNISLIHSHFGNRGFYDLKLKKRLKVPQITAFYGHDASMMAQSPKWKIRFKELFENCEAFLAEGNHMKKTLMELGCDQSKIHVQHLGVDLEKIPFIPRKIEKGRNVKILIASTFRDKKGITYCIEAFANVLSRNKNIELAIIGDAGRSKREVLYKQEVLNVIQKRGLKDKIKLLGFLDYSDFIEEAKNHDIFLSHSIKGSDGETEGGAPVTLIEMSAYGMPVVSTFHCDIPEIILDGSSGFLVKEKDVDSLTQRLEYLVCHPETWQEMGSLGRLHIEREYNAKIQASKLKDIYTGLLKN